MAIKIPCLCFAALKTNLDADQFFFFFFKGNSIRNIRKNWTSPIIFSI